MCVGCQYIIWYISNTYISIIYIYILLRKKFNFYKGNFVIRNKKIYLSIWLLIWDWIIQNLLHIFIKAGGPTVAILLEYDALPEIGHACGHNLIAEAGLAAAVAVKKAMEEDRTIAGKVSIKY